VKPDHYQEAYKIWKQLAAAKPEEHSKQEFDTHLRLLSFFMPGDYYYYIFNLNSGRFDFVSEDVLRVLGYEAAEVDVPFFISKIHPEDQPWFLNFENKVMEFFNLLTQEQIPNYKVRYDYRVRKKNGDYIRILQQVITIDYNEQNPVLRTFGVHSDITYLKSTGAPVLSFIGLNGEPSYLNVETEKKFSILAGDLSKRELEILQQLAEGKSSELIGRQLFISKKTVDTHRKNLLRKTGAANTVELISTAVRKGWL
jgi:DNA-binding CsgD family transcriptional regulator